LAPVQLLENAVDWSLEDRGLLSIRSRGHFARTLVPMTADSQALWEYANYGVAVLGVIAVFVLFRLSRKQATSRYARILSQGSV
jgi:ABC-2 type transport system permease protein